MLFQSPEELTRTSKSSRIQAQTETTTLTGLSTPSVQPGTKSNIPAIVAGVVLVAIIVTSGLVYVVTRPTASGPPVTVTVCGTVSSQSLGYSQETYRLDFQSGSQLSSAALSLTANICFQNPSGSCSSTAMCYILDLTNTRQYNVTLQGTGQLIIHQSCGGLYVNQPSSPYRSDVSC